MYRANLRPKERAARMNEKRLEVEERSAKPSRKSEGKRM
jgi:hypothetical protein